MVKFIFDITKPNHRATVNHVTLYNFSQTTDVIDIQTRNWDHQNCCAFSNVYLLLFTSKRNRNMTMKKKEENATKYAHF